MDKLKKKVRSLDQNAYYWGVVIELMSDETGFTTEEMHEALKQKFLMIEKNGMKFPRSTSSLTTGEFSEYVEKCKMFAAEWLGIFIPDAERIEL